MIKDEKLKRWFADADDNKNCELTKILGVEYAHIILDSQDDLYLTSYGLPFMEHLMPENFWLDKEWIKKNSQKLSGTSSIYKVCTKCIKGKDKDTVIKWNRMGQDIPAAQDLVGSGHAAFNSPFEEFSLVVELRNVLFRSREKIPLQKPLAIYVPAKNIELSRLGRKEYLMKELISSHRDVELDMHRSYAMIYEWIKGVDAIEALNAEKIKEEDVRRLTLKGEEKLNHNGFSIRDRKPHHVIVRPRPGGEPVKDKKGEYIFGLVDYELLERLPAREKKVKTFRRRDYLKRQKDRFIRDKKIYHPHLAHMNIFGADHIYGHVESTKGRLWVVGNDPFLFDYFLPERWENTPRTRISRYGRIYYTLSKDNIHIVWKFSNVGQQPDMDPFKDDEKLILQYGFNSPFEEVAIALELSRKGIPTIYPRAIYMAGNETETARMIADESRYESHSKILSPDGKPVLERKREYITIWGYWNGPDDKLAYKDGDYYEGVDTLRAYREGIITKEQYIAFLNMAKERLAKVNFRDLNLRGNHLLLSIDSKGNFVKSKEEKPELRISNFEFLQRMKGLTNE